MSDTATILGNAAKGLAQGAAFGAVGGPIGAGAGAAIGLALQLAPQLSKWIVGDDGSTAAQVVQTVQSIAGAGHPADPAALDPSTRTNLALELARVAADREAAHDLARNDELASLIADTASARTRDMEIRKSGGQNVRADIMLVAVTIGLLACIISAAMGTLGADTAVFGLVSGIAGMLTGCFKDAFTFEFGSSRQSENKTNIIADLARTTVPTIAIPRLAPQRPAPLQVPAPTPAPAAEDKPLVVVNSVTEASQPAPGPAPEPIEPVIIPQRTEPSRQPFFDAVRHTAFDGHLVQSQVEGCEKILDFWNTFAPNGDIRHLAYTLATVCWETGRTMQPVEEVGRGAGRFYGPSGFYGRGLVQITLEENYRKMSAVAGLDLVANPEKALEWPIALKLLFVGMTQGLFTGKKLSDFFNDSVSDPVGARAIINGHDRAQEIAALHQAFLAALEAEAEPK